MISPLAQNNNTLSNKQAITIGLSDSGTDHYLNGQSQAGAQIRLITTTPNNITHNYQHLSCWQTITINDTDFCIYFSYQILNVLCLSSRSYIFMNVNYIQWQHKYCSSSSMLFCFKTGNIYKYINIYIHTHIWHESIDPVDCKRWLRGHFMEAPELHW